jgi:hypothetical protein
MRPDDSKRTPKPADVTDRPATNAVDPADADKVKGGATPRDPATGLPTGKRM